MNKYLFFLLATILISKVAYSQSIEGSWQLKSLNGEEITDREVIKLMTDSYFALGSKALVDNSFLGAAGGEFKVKGNQLIEKRDFDTYDDDKINVEKTYKLVWIDDHTHEISDAEHVKVWKKLKDRSDDLNGNWVITGRTRNGEMNKMTPGNRRTVKILSGGRLQWIAFNSATKSFNGTGGGMYKAKNGNYEEQISFFFRDNNRVGDTLNFEYKIINNAWHHKGKSSKGQPIYEIWSPYAMAFPTNF